MAIELVLGWQELFELGSTDSDRGEQSSMADSTQQTEQSFVEQVKAAVALKISSRTHLITPDTHLQYMLLKEKSYAVPYFLIEL